VESDCVVLSCVELIMVFTSWKGGQTNSVNYLVFLCVRLFHVALDVWFKKNK